MYVYESATNAKRDKGDCGSVRFGIPVRGLLVVFASWIEMVTV